MKKLNLESWRIGWGVARCEVESGVAVGVGSIWTCERADALWVNLVRLLGCDETRKR